MSKLLKKNGEYIQLRSNEERISIITCTINEATVVSDDDANVLQKYLGVEIVDVPAKWGIFYEKRVNVGFTKTQQLVAYGIVTKGVNNLDIGIALRDKDSHFLCKPILFDTYTDALKYAQKTAELLELNYAELYIEKI